MIDPKDLLGIERRELTQMLIDGYPIEPEALVDRGIVECAHSCAPFDAGGAARCGAMGPNLAIGPQSGG